MTLKNLQQTAFAYKPSRADLDFRFTPGLSSSDFYRSKKELEFLVSQLLRF